MDKRPRVQQACAGCKFSKLRCSGEQPCDTCQKRGEECIFGSVASLAASGTPVVAPRKRGPPPGLARSLREENAVLKEQISRLEAGVVSQGPRAADYVSPRDALILHSRPESGALGFCNAPVMYYAPNLTKKVRMYPTRALSPAHHCSSSCRNSSSPNGSFPQTFSLHLSVYCVSQRKVLPAWFLPRCFRRSLGTSPRSSMKWRRSCPS